jgi:hypothetical protein
MYTVLDVSYGFSNGLMRIICPFCIIFIVLVYRVLNRIKVYPSKLNIKFCPLPAINRIFVNYGCHIS